MNDETVGRYTEETARQIVTRNHGKCGPKTVSHPQPGIKVQGAIDYLVKYCGYNRLVE